MSKNKNNFKCPKCGCTSYTEYNDKLRNGAIGAAVGAFLLEPIGLLAAGFGTGVDSTGKNATTAEKKYRISCVHKIDKPEVLQVNHLETLLSINLKMAISKQCRSIATMMID